MTKNCTCKAEHWQPHAETCPAYKPRPLLTLENIRSGAVPSDAMAVGFLLGLIERLEARLETQKGIIANHVEAERAHEPKPQCVCDPEFGAPRCPVHEPNATPGATFVGESSSIVEDSRPRELQADSIECSACGTKARAPGGTATSLWCYKPFCPGTYGQRTTALQK